MSAKNSSSNAQPWYQDGLKFSCTGCGNCCTGAEGYVWVNQEEIASLAAVMDQSVDEFEAMYVRKIGIRKSLKELPVSFDCVFFDSQTRKCQVYDARPRQCRTWPFWDSNVKSPAQWERTCEVCPGSGTGKLYSLGEIEQQRSIVKI